MDVLRSVLPIILYVLLAILVVVLIIFVIKLMKTLSKVDKVVDDVAVKSSKLNGVFDFIDTTTDTLSLVSNKFSGFVAGKIGSVLKKKGRKKDE